MPKKLNLSHIKKRATALENNVLMALAVVVIVILWMLSGLFSSQAVPPHPEVIKPQKQVQVLRIQAEPYTRHIVVSAVTEPHHMVNLSARIEGQIEEILADRGDTVNKGDTLLLIEKEQRAEALQTAKFKLKQARSLYKASKKLNKEGYRADTSLDGQRAELAQAQENLVIAQNNLAYTKISSPINSFIEDRFVDVGDYVKKGTPVYSLVTKGRYKIIAYISQKDRSAIHIGKPAFATLATGQDVSGTITFIASNAHRLTHTYKVEVSLTSQKMIPTGMSAQLSIPTTTIKAQLAPYVAMVLNDKGNLGVIILEDTNIAKFIAINPLDDNGNGFYIEGSHDVIDLVVKGQSSLINGEIVIPHMTKKAPQGRKLY